jgi:hypothetical protein
MDTVVHLSHSATDLHAELHHQCGATTAPTAAPTAHHCDAGTDYCWADAAGEASATCTSSTGNDYTCECPTGYIQTVVHLSHAASELHVEVQHACAATVAPTAAPTAHHCDAGTHYCWADAAGEAAATCTATVGDDYSCECPVGYEQTIAHFNHADDLAEALKHECAATVAPTAAPTAHHCDAGTNYCWAAADGVTSATCTAISGDDYTCECPAGYLQTRLT